MVDGPSVVEMQDPLVEASIPHRPPFLFVDRVRLVTENNIVAERTLRPDEFYFRGHYPQFPIVPGVLLCESLFQTAGIFMSECLKERPELRAKIPVLVRIGDAKFKRRIYPCETIVMEVHFEKNNKNFYFFRGVVRKDEQIAMTASFILTLVDP
jgi:3-hydroxyacyl-[acyl-carrier-protein] dehydratase